jgi:hypothetical protein
MEENRKRYIGLDVHKHYLIALGVDTDLNVVLPARRVELFRLEAWMKKSLTKQDEVVLEMTTNTWQLYDELIQYAGKSDSRASTARGTDHAVASHERQDRRFDPGAAVGQRLAGRDLDPAAGNPGSAWAGGATTEDGATGNAGEEPPARRDPTPSPGSARRQSVRSKEQRSGGCLCRWGNWKSSICKVTWKRCSSRRSKSSDMTRRSWKGWRRKQEEIGRLLHLAGFGVVTAVTVWAAIGTISSASQNRQYLVGYAGLGTRVHDSGMTSRSGKITKAGDETCARC